MAAIAGIKLFLTSGAQNQIELSRLGARQGGVALRAIVLVESSALPTRSTFDSGCIVKCEICEHTDKIEQQREDEPENKSCVRCTARP